ncbi:MAG TPA: hypothetical protein DCP06_05915 [Lachnospiraceae bacterium]|nr:hypothetical protein [Lachnospiraceae bacterium]
MNRVRICARALTAVLVLACLPTGNAAAATAYRTETVYDPINVEAVVKASAPVYMSDLTTRKQINSKAVTVKANTSVKVINEKISSNIKWFRLSFLVGTKTYTGYVRNKYITLKPASPASAKIVSDAERALRVAAEATTKVKQNGTKVMLANKKAVKVIEEKYVGTAKWYKVKATVNKKSIEGYIKPKYVQLTKTKRTVKIYALTEEEFEKDMEQRGIPDIYKSYLRTLHEQYPFWEFRTYETGIKWATALKNESKIGRNLISNSKSAAWKSTDPAAYDSSTGKWKIFDGSTWVAASKEAVAYYMDPRNFLNERTIFQFELQEYQKDYHTLSGVEQILLNTPFASAKFSYTDPLTGKSAKMTYANAYMTAAVNSGVSPIHLASRSKQEVVTSATTVSGSVSGTHKQYPGIYNFYNIGATSGKDAAANGLKWASTGDTYMRPWTDPYRSIVGGAMYIGSGYINKGQNTIYLEKFNVTATDRYNHQYMTNVEAANSEALKIQKAYQNSGLLTDTPLVFSIPVYKNMPDTPAAIPSK